MPLTKRYWRKLAMLLKRETAYGTDATPLVADAIVAKNVSFSPFEGEEQPRDLIVPHLGSLGTILSAVHGKLEFDLEMAGAGAKGSVAKYGTALRIAALSETITAGTKVDYAITEALVDSASLYFEHGLVRHVFLGTQANLQFDWTPPKLGNIRVTILGLLGEISDQGSLPAVGLTGWTKPVAVSKANTSVSLHGIPVVTESLQINLGNVLTPRFLIGDERVLITDRKTTGTIVVEANPLSEVNWFALATAGTTGALTVTHGTVDGNIVEVTAPAVQIGMPTVGQTNGVMNYSLPLDFQESALLNSLKITTR